MMAVVFGVLAVGARELELLGAASSSVSSATVSAAKHVNEDSADDHFESGAET